MLLFRTSEKVRKGQGEELHKSIGFVAFPSLAPCLLFTPLGGWSKWGCCDKENHNSLYGQYESLYDPLWLN